MQVGGSGRHHIEVVDLSSTRAPAAYEQILAVPTPARQLPLPVRKVVGDLADANRPLAGLQLQLPASDTTWPAGKDARYSPGSRSDWFHQIQPDFS